MNNGPRIISILGGSGRSGSSLVGQILGATPDAIYVGETRHLWVLGLRDGGTCTCGQSFQDCKFWGAVIDQVISLGHSPERIGEDIERLPSVKQLRAMKDLTDTLPHLAAAIPALHAAIGRISGANVVVDTSKHPGYVALMQEQNELDAVVRLTRDPRAVTHSWSQSKSFQHSDGKSYTIAGQPRWKAAVSWILHHRQHDALARNAPERFYCRYEDLAKDAEELILKMVTALRLGKPPLEDGVFNSPPAHAVAGNPSSRSIGPIVIRNDERWRNNMPRQVQLIVALLTLPWFARYGYASPRLTNKVWNQ